MKPIDLVLRLEWAAVLAVAIAGYALADGSWLMFSLLILAPDLSMLGYLAGPAVGALAYNALHILVWPAALFIVGLLAGSPIAEHVAIIWVAHIAMDRALGYGLKLPTGFADTHLGTIGRKR